MPRYMVQRTFPDRLQIPMGDGGAELCRAVIEQRTTAAHNGLPVDEITRVSVLDPYFYV